MSTRLSTTSRIASRVGESVLRMCSMSWRRSAIRRLICCGVQSSMWSSSSSISSVRCRPGRGSPRSPRRSIRYAIIPGRSFARTTALAALDVERLPVLGCLANRDRLVLGQDEVDLLVVDRGPPPAPRRRRAGSRRRTRPGPRAGAAARPRAWRGALSSSSALSWIWCGSASWSSSGVGSSRSTHVAMRRI